MSYKALSHVLYSTLAVGLMLYPSNGMAGHNRGQGAETCKVAAKALADPYSHAGMPYTAWLAGYLTALSSVEASDEFDRRFNDVSTKDLAGAARAYCQLNQEARFSRAVFEVYKQLGGKLQKAE